MFTWIVLRNGDWAMMKVPIEVVRVSDKEKEILIKIFLVFFFRIHEHDPIHFPWAGGQKFQLGVSYWHLLYQASENRYNENRPVAGAYRPSPVTV